MNKIQINQTKKNRLGRIQKKKESMDLGLVEYKPANNTYNLTPLLKEKLKK
ncbi:MAG TPA: hypothetical protein VK186_22460 [Candidatus Deferrimicrobium sp.]|nr:hypothetical protein [Candidatus Kapabacteria bacterium]HLP61620.1 hypothetical protein [Candidatus Deferrimicrobium sp.]